MLVLALGVGPVPWFRQCVEQYERGRILASIVEAFHAKR
jgi:hypothetical protein